MMLLYCVNGVVVGTHDDLQNVPGNAYGQNVRIIPFAGLMSDLPRVGDPPVFPARDTRPYAQPVETPDILKTFASQVRFDAVTSGFTWNGIQIKTDRLSQLMIGNLAQYAATVTNNTKIDFTQSGVHNQITAQQAKDLNAQVNAFVQRCRSLEAQCLTDLNSAAPTLLTYEDIENVFVSQRSQVLGT
jgi:hypothetical protein